MIAELPVITDVMTKLEVAADEQGWDQPATLWALYAERITDDATAIGVGPFPGFDIAIAGTGHSFHALRLIQAAWQVSPDRPDMSGLIGIALVDEAWSVRHQSDQPRPTGRFAEHPDRIEQRFVILTAADGSINSMVRVRGAGTLASDGRFREGRLIDAMLGLLEQCFTAEGEG